jgi:hypothetical protein
LVAPTTLVDTAAALTTGNLHFFAAIAKAYPHTAHAIYTPKDYSSITLLSGIVEDINGASITTDLTVAFSFHLPYFTREGAPTTFLVLVGPNVTVNTILGLPFIQQTKMIIDAADQVAELRSLNPPPFPIDFRRAQGGVPTISASKDPVNESHFTDIIQEITNIESLYCAQARRTQSYHPSRNQEQQARMPWPTSPFQPCHILSRFIVATICWCFYHRQ